MKHLLYFAFCFHPAKKVHEPRGVRFISFVHFSRVRISFSWQGRTKMIQHFKGFFFFRLERKIFRQGYFKSHFGTLYFQIKNLIRTIKKKWSMYTFYVKCSVISLVMYKKNSIEIWNIHLHGTSNFLSFTSNFDEQLSLCVCIYINLLVNLCVCAYIYIYINTQVDQWIFGDLDSCTLLCLLPNQSR